LTSLLL